MSKRGDAQLEVKRIADNGFKSCSDDNESTCSKCIHSLITENLLNLKCALTPLLVYPWSGCNRFKKKDIH